MTWAAIKNHDDGRLVISSPDQYAEVIESLKVYGDAKEVEENFPKDMIKRFAAEAAAKTAQYRIAVANFLNSKIFLENKLSIDELPKLYSPEFERIPYDFRYGENPHQKKSAGYRNINAKVSIFDAEILNEGKVPSYNNIADMNAAIMMMLDFKNEKYEDKRVDIILKHGNPCGVGVGDDAFNLACETDQISRFGGIYITNRILTINDVENIGKKYLEVILAPGYEEGVVKALVDTDGRRRIFDIKKIMDKFDKKDLMINSVIGGVIVQDYNSGMYDMFDTVTETKPTDEEIDACDLAYRIVKHCNSNAIVLSRANQAIGLGVGQMSRVDSVEIAIGKAKAAGFNIEGSVMASDAFFPKADAPMAAINEGIAGIIQPGGSMFDEEVIEMAKKEGKFMIITGMRHFKHNR
jgi:phosphoribosylaminoimidazolecarboxamide formyltransferase/IMP cyclohydrolase